MTVLTVLVVVALVVVAGLALGTAAGAPLERAATLGAWAAEALLVMTAVVDVVKLLRDGGRSSELAVHLGYVAVSVLLLPLLVRPLEDDATDDDVRGRQLVLSLACVALLVVVWRERVTA